MTYLLRDIDPELWTRVKVRAAREGVSMRAVLIRLLRAYVAGRA
jgi:plasmid stability protein